MEESSQRPSGLSCQWLRSDREAVYVALRGHIRRAEEPTLKSLTEALMNQPPPRCYLDLSGVHYVDSTGLGLLTSLRGQLSEQSSTLGLVAPSEAVLKVLRMSQLDRVFDVVPPEGAADLRVELPEGHAANETLM